MELQEGIMETLSCVTFWNNYKDRLSDPEFMKKEIAVNKLMEPLGFDVIFAVEHHFSNYSMGPDHFQFLGYLAAIANHIKIGYPGGDPSLERPIARGGTHDSLGSSFRWSRRIRYGPGLGKTRVRGVSSEYGGVPRAF
jgi:hypothetical protein